MMTRTLKLTHTSADYNFTSKSEFIFSFVSLDDMPKIVNWVGNLPNFGKIVATAKTNTTEYRLSAFIEHYADHQDMYAHFMRWIRFVFADMFIDE